MNDNKRQRAIYGECLLAQLNRHRYSKRHQKVPNEGPKVSQMFIVMGTRRVPVFWLLQFAALAWTTQACFEYSSVKPNPCSEKKCPFGAQCIPSFDGQTAECACPSKCPSFGDSRGSRPVCGDGQDYENLCELNRHACRLNKTVSVRFGACDPCYGVECPESQICQIDDQRNPICKCNAACSNEYNPVCSRNGKSYLNECILRLEACKGRKSERILHEGVCSESNPCKAIKCSVYQECEVNMYGIAECKCPTTCPALVKPVCGTDSLSYNSECELRRQACLSQRNITIRYMGVCDSGTWCHLNHGICQFGSVCQSLGQTNYSCVCPPCSEEYFPVCAVVDGISITYMNLCKFRHDMCQKKISNVTFRQGTCEGCENINCMFYSYCEANPGPAKCTCPQYNNLSYDNECKLMTATCESTTQIGVKTKSTCEVSGAIRDVSSQVKLCPVNTCKYDGICVLNEKHGHHCLCKFNCSSNYNGQQICGSDGRLYSSECAFREEMCNRQQDIKPVETIYCEKNRNIPCEGEPPVLDAVTRKEYNCSEDTCPEQSYCHRGLNFAKCCRELDPDEDCYDSLHGCCPDEKTPSLGLNHAGCPSTCQCNRLGSYLLKCDPVTKQCYCKPGVGGIRCDRCEAGYWGLHKISEGNAGCIPCKCNKVGASRDDCEQMTGRCVCRAGFNGMKCDICADGSLIESYGCTRVESISCIENSQCKFGAICRNSQCRCDIDCSTSEKAPVCASDGSIFESDCHLKQWSCKAQKHLSVVNAEKCRSSAKNSATTSPVRRSTEYQNYDKSTRKVNVENEVTLGTGPTMPTLHWDSESEQLPFFGGDAFIEMRTLQAYSTVVFQLEFITYEDEGLLVFNAQTSTGEGDYIALLLKNSFVEFRFNLGSGSVVLRSIQPITLGQNVNVVSGRHLSDGFLSVDGFENITGKSEGPHKLLDLGENLFVGGTPYSDVKKIADILGTKKNFTGCLRALRINGQLMNLNPGASTAVLSHLQVDSCSRQKCSQTFCQNGGTCIQRDRQYTCLCIPSFTGSRCQHNGQTCLEADCPASTGLAQSIDTWDFWNDSYIELPTLQGVSQAFIIEVWLMARSPSGLILYNGQSLGDFVELSLVDGYVQYSFNLGGHSNKSGIMSIKSSLPLLMGEWHRIVITRQVKEGILQINDEPAIHGVAKGNLNELNLDEPLYLGGIGEKVKKNNRENSHFNGAIQRITLNGNLWQNVLSRASKVNKVNRYLGPPCGYENPCQNQGKCIALLNSFVCQCVTEFHGAQCEQTVETDTSVKPVQFDSSFFVEYNTNNFPLSNQQQNVIEITLHTKSGNGLIVWTSKDSQAITNNLAIVLIDGFLEFSFDLGKQSRTIRSSSRIDDGETHHIIVTRNKQVGILQIDHKYMNSTVSEKGAADLNTDGKLWIGGFSNLPPGLPDAYYSPFSGCLLSVRIDGIALELSSLTGELISKC